MDAHTTPIPQNNITTAPRHVDPDHETAQREAAIAEVVSNLSDDVRERIGALRDMLDKIEQSLLYSAADAKARLGEHVAVCIRINKEITQLTAVIHEIKEQADQNTL